MAPAQPHELLRLLLLVVAAFAAIVLVFVRYAGVGRFAARRSRPPPPPL